MKYAGLLALFSVFAFTCFIPRARAGVIQHAGKQIAKGADSATQAVSGSSAAVVTGAASAGHAAVNAAGVGVTGAKETGAVAAGGTAAGVSVAADTIARATTTAARKAWRFVW